MIKYLVPIVFIGFGLMSLLKPNGDVDTKKSNRTFNKTRDTKWMRVVGAIMIVLGVVVFVNML